MPKATKAKHRALFIALALYVVVVALLVRDRYIRFTSDEFIGEESTVSVKKEPEPEPKKTEVAIKASALLEVPFTVQAPFGVWDALHEETCEEASLMMVQHFLTNKKFVSPQVTDTELKALVAWETDHGYKVDVTVAEVSEIASRYYSLNSGRVIKNPTVEDIKREISAGRPVIVPAAGRILPNPHFTPPGPKYHMLVIKGYDADGFITNDPGTRHGESFRYTFNSLMEAIHDWDSDNIFNGQKAVLVFD